MMFAKVSELCDAVRRYDDERVAELLNEGVDVNGIGRLSTVGFKKRITALYVASYYGRLETAKLLIEKGADVNTAVDDGQTPVYGAAIKGFWELVKLLIEKGADVNIAAKDESTPLWAATQEGRLAVVKLFIENGCPVESPASGIANFTLLSVAAEQGHLEIAKFLIEKGANVQARLGFNNSPLHVASRCGRKDVARFLLDNGADIEAVNDDQETPLHFSVNDWHSVELLLQLGADVEALNKDGLTAWEKAEKFGYLQTKDLILSWRRSRKPILIGTNGFEERPNRAYVQDGNAIILKPPPIAEAEEEAKEYNPVNNYLLAYVIDSRKSKVKRLCRKFRSTSDFISEIHTTMDKSVDEKNCNLEQLKIQYSRKQEKRGKEAERLKERIEEMLINNCTLSQERKDMPEELALKVITLEGTKTQLIAQIEEIKREHQEELDHERLKSKRELEILHDDLLQDGERRIKKLESRIEELERENRTLLEQHVSLQSELDKLVVEYEEIQNISQSSENVNARVSVKKVLTFKGASGLLEGTKCLWDKLHEAGELTKIKINSNYIQSLGSVNGSIVGDVETVVANI